MQKVVEVEWFDAQQSNQPTFMEDIEKYKPVLTKSVGYLLFEKDEYTILGSGLFFDGVGNGVGYHIIIPSGMIKKINILREELP